ncbi:MAG: LacI family DNA-binding transcriptional regulator [Candidatus Methylacidiphilales bacterium]|nr:LacI family DNA-binding transcriptional regulator [Candidatus Methylacidiphilales bacterium]
MRQIAKEAGVHCTTVSLALRQHPRIPVATRERILAVAERMGYRRNPRVGWLMGQLRSPKTAVYRSHLAYLVPTLDTVREDPYYRRHFEGARRRAGQLGFELELFPAAPGTALPLIRQLRARGIPGLLVSGLDDSAMLLAPEWNRFAVVTVGFALPHLPSVCNHQFESVLRALEKLTRFGYRRIALHLSVSDDLWSNHTMLAAFLYYQRSQPVSNRLAPLLYDRHDAKAWTAWLRRTRPDAVLSDNGDILQMLGQAGVRVPRDMGCAHLHWIPEHGRLAGIYQSLETVGAAAVDLLGGMLQRGECGGLSLARTLLIEGRWRGGASIRRRA